MDNVSRDMEIVRKNPKRNAGDKNTVTEIKLLMDSLVDLKWLKKESP